MPIKHIDSNVALTQLVDYLVSEKRNRVVCVFTMPFIDTAARFDFDDIAKNTEQFCDHYLIVDSQLTRQMQDEMGDGYVFGGAARTYPVGFSLEGDSFAPLRMAPNLSNLEKLTNLIEQDIYHFASASAHFEQARETAVEAVATVRGVYGPSVVAVTVGPNNDYATIQQELTFPGLPVEWMFQVGQKLKGRYVSSEKLFLLDSASPTLESFVEKYPFGSVTLGLVKATDRQRALIQVHPKLEFEVSKLEITGNPYDVVSKYLDVGDVVSVRVYRDPQGRTRLRLDDIDDDEVVFDALTLVEGAEPWLIEGRDFSIESETNLDDEVPTEITSRTDFESMAQTIADLEAQLAQATQASAAPIVLIPRPGNYQTAPTESIAKPSETNLLRTAVNSLSATIKKMREDDEGKKAELAQLLQNLSSAKKELTELRAAKSGATSEAKQLRRENRKSSSKQSSTFSRRARFSNDEDWFREEVRRAWIGRYSPEDRLKYVLDDSKYIFDSKFFSSFNEGELDEDEARKSVRAVLDLVTGRSAIEKIREAHAVLSGGKSIVRDGDHAMRMHIENSTAQAKRLTYYKLRSGGFELIKVAMHDNFEV